MGIYIEWMSYCFMYGYNDDKKLRIIYKLKQEAMEVDTLNWLTCSGKLVPKWKLKMLSEHRIHCLPPRIKVACVQNGSKAKTSFCSAIMPQ